MCAHVHASLTTIRKPPSSVCVCVCVLQPCENGCDYHILSADNDENVVSLTT